VIQGEERGKEVESTGKIRTNKKDYKGKLKPRQATIKGEIILKRRRYFTESSTGCTDVNCSCEHPMKIHDQLSK
jgi:hypothetical protein